MNIHEILKTEPTLPFVEYMRQVLYSPEFGYYSTGCQPFGKEGDFITAPELTPLFGLSLARQCQQILVELDKPCLFEFGAGSGRLCIDLLTGLAEVNCLPEQYYILEVSANLRRQQQDTIRKALPETLSARVKWLDQWPDSPFNGIVLANEVLDAMPVHRFMQSKNGLMESFISLDAKGQLAEHFQPSQDERLLNYVSTAVPQNEPSYISEANLFIDSWLESCYRMLDQGVVLLIDYGFPRHEYYHPDRNQGTLICHHRHQAHSDFLAHPGEQDITAHVDFTHVAEAAVDAGFDVSGYTNQASFLVANGLLSLLESLGDERERFRATQAAKQLIQPSEMGELFKVIALSKALPLSLQGFLLHDKRASL